jgi:hypothetical protein
MAGSSTIITRFLIWDVQLCMSPSSYVSIAHFVTTGDIDLKHACNVPLGHVGTSQDQISVWFGTWLGHQGAKTEKVQLLLN